MFVWTKEKCLEEALKYKTKKEFQMGSKNAYYGAHRHGWIDEICTHMIIVGNRFNRSVYCYEFPDNSVYIGLTYDLNKRNNEHSSNEKSQVFKHIKKTKYTPNFKQLTKYLPAKEAQKMEEYYIEFYKSEKWNILNKAKPGSLGIDILVWNFENCKNEALKYTDRTSFIKFSSGAYKSASIYGWIDEICGHMPIKIKRKFWDVDKCRVEALKYKTRNQFKKNACDAYSFAYRNNLLDEICVHMKRYNNNFKL